MLARELITRENNIIERIIGQESETPLSAGPLITSLFHVNVLRDINYLGGDGQLAGFKGDHCPFSSPFLPSSLFFFFSISFFFLILFPRFSRFIANRGRSFDRDSQPIGKFFFDRVCASVIIPSNKSNQRCSCSTFAIIIEIEIRREKHPRF